MKIEVIPAMDIMGGKVVRLRQGDYSERTIYPDSPEEMARKLAGNGAEWLHLVDLDGARASSPVNLDVMEKIAGNTGLSVEWGGGLETEDALQSVFDAGASRAICGSIAVKSPESFSAWLGRFGPGRIVLGADVRDGLVAISGWMENTSISVSGIVSAFLPAGLSQVICTDISKDGMLGGPSWPVYEKLKAEFPQISVTVSGGVSSVRDIEKADALGMDGIIVGKAMYEGLIKMEELGKWWRNG